MPPESHSSSLARCLRFSALAALGCAAPAFGEASLVGNSPFAAAGAASVGPNAPAEAYELSGSTVEGSDVSVCIFERQRKRSEWIPVGGDADGVKVISFDANTDTAVVVIGGARKQISMRKSVVASVNSPGGNRPAPPVIAPVAPLVPIASAPAAAPATPATVAQDQREARMLVSDLLEIGVQQRKAYQDAKQKAASGAPAQPEN
jgi:hypothetical protein